MPPTNLQYSTLTKTTDIPYLIANSDNPTGYFDRLIISLNLPAHLNVTTRLGSRIISSPVAGFRPRRSFFSLTQNLPKPTDQTQIDLKTAQSLIDGVALPELTALHTEDCPGPTGESNRLTSFLRGRTLCLGPDVELQMNLVGAVGGVGVPLPNLDLETLEHLQGFASVVHWGDDGEQRRARQALARREGPILPLATGQDIAWALMAEQHICIDTTASGGNTELLSGGA